MAHTTPTPFPSRALAHTRLSWDQEMPQGHPCAKTGADPMREESQGCPHHPAMGRAAKGGSAQHCQGKSPSQAGGHGIIAWFEGVWL